MDDVESVCGVTSSMTQRISARVYEITNTLKSVKEKIFHTNNGPKLLTPKAKYSFTRNLYEVKQTFYKKVLHFFNKYIFL